jgi:hypothetical protein
VTGFKALILLLISRSVTLLRTLYKEGSKNAIIICNTI